VNDAVRIPVSVAIALIAHLILASGLRAKKKVEPDRLDVVTVRVVAPPPQPEPPPPEPPPPEPPPPPEEPIHELTPRTPKARPTTRTTQVEPPPEPPPETEKPQATGPTTTKPVYGVTMESTSTRGAGPTVPVGNTVQTKPDATSTAPADVKPLPPPVAAHQVSKAPIPKGRCSGTYTDAARQAGLEGVVVLDLVVGADGRARDIKVVSGLEHGLTEAAVTALERCTFTPGERDGVAVAVKVRGFKIRFFLREGE
jgi:protein TonB